MADLLKVTIGDLKMSSKNEEARTDGYQRGIDGKSSGVTWGNATFDTNEQYQARQVGYEEGRRDRIRSDYEKGNK
jgi:ribosome modulation factor